MKLNSTQAVALGVAAAMAFTDADARSMRRVAALPATVTVSSTAALTTALNSASCGTVIALAPGSYTNFDVSNKTFAGGCNPIITSAHADVWAQFHNFNMSNVNNLTFQNLTFVADFGLANAYVFSSVNNVMLNHLYVHGSLDGDPSNDGPGIGFFDGNFNTIMNSEFEQLGDRALAVTATAFSSVLGTGNQVIANRFHDEREDALDAAQQTNMRVIDNVFHSFSVGVGDHPDAIQFNTSNTSFSSSKVLIGGNLICRGYGANAQSIFLTDQIGTIPYVDFTVANNVITGTGSGAIDVESGTSLTLASNLLATFSGGDNTPILLVSVAGVNSTNNSAIVISEKLSDGNTGVVSSGDVTPAAVTDKGAAAVAVWKSAHPGRVACPVLP